MRISDWSSDVCSSDLEFAGYEQPPRSQLSQDLVEIRLGKGQTAFAPAKLAMFPNHLRPDIPGAVDHNRPRLRMAVRGVHSLQPHGTTVLAGVIIAGQVRPVRCGIPAEIVRTALHPYQIHKIRPPANNH